MSGTVICPTCGEELHAVCYHDVDRIRAEAAAERTREIVLGLHEDAASWRTMAAKMVKDEDRLMCDRRAWVLEGRAYAIASRYGVDGEPAEAFPKPGSGNRDHAPGCATFGVAYNRCDCKPGSGDGR